MEKNAVNAFIYYQDNPMMYDNFQKTQDKFLMVFKTLMTLIELRKQTCISRF